MNVKRTADVCLILEGTYPYVTGGVSTWVHDLLEAQHDLTFHLVALVPRQANLMPRYKIPDNVLSVTHVVVQQLPAGVRSVKKLEGLFKRIGKPGSGFRP